MTAAYKGLSRRRPELVEIDPEESAPPTVTSQATDAAPSSDRRARLATLLSQRRSSARPEEVGADTEEDIQRPVRVPRDGGRFSDRPRRRQ